MRVSVIGGGSLPPELMEITETLGEQLGERGHTVVCGGLTGSMEAVCRGVAGTRGSSIGILPGTDPRAANEYVDTVITTGLGNARNVLVVMNGEGVIAVDGSSGTLSEIGHALDFGKPIVGIETFSVDGVTPVSGPEEAIMEVENQVP